MADEFDIARATTPLFPYSDGSGFEISVRVTHTDGADWDVSIHSANSTVSFDAEQWPQIRDEINRLLSTFANRPCLAKEDGNG